MYFYKHLESLAKMEAHQKGMLYSSKKINYIYMYNTQFFAEQDSQYCIHWDHRLLAATWPNNRMSNCNSGRNYNFDTRCNSKYSSSSIYYVIKIRRSLLRDSRVRDTLIRTSVMKYYHASVNCTNNNSSALTQFRRFCSFFFCSSELLDDPDVADVWDEIDVSDPHDRTFGGWGVGLNGAGVILFVLFFVLSSPPPITSLAMTGGGGVAGAIRNFWSCCSNAAQTVC